MANQLRINAKDPKWWLWGGSRQSPVITGRTAIISLFIMLIAIIIFLISLFSGSPIKRQLATTRQVSLPAQLPATSSSTPAQNTPSSTSNNSSTAAIPVVAEQVAEQGALAEVDGEWAGVATAPGVGLTPPIGQVGQSATIKSTSLSLVAQPGQSQSLVGTATVLQGSTSFVVEVEAQIYNSQWVFIPQQGGAVQSSGS